MARNMPQQRLIVIDAAVRGRFHTLDTLIKAYVSCVVEEVISQKSVDFTQMKRELNLMHRLSAREKEN